MKKVQHIALSIALFFTVSLSAFAQEADGNSGTPWYQVDLVVFRHLTNDSSEAWPAVTDHKRPENAISLKIPYQAHNTNSPLPDSSESDNPLPSQHDLMRDAYIALPASEMLLKQQANALEKNRNYQVIAQQAWRMPVNAQSARHPVTVRAVINGENTLLLDGTVTISKERFLHADIDLWLNRLSPEPQYSTAPDKTYNNGENIDNVRIADPGSKNLIRLHKDSPPLQITDNFQLKQRRRVRNTGEIQYVDSPEIGVLLKLTPYKRPNSRMETGSNITETGS